MPCRILTPPLFAFCSTVPFKEVKLPCTMGRITNVKVYLEPNSTSTPFPYLALLLRGQPALWPDRPRPQPALRHSKWKLTVQSVQLFFKSMHRALRCLSSSDMRGQSWYFRALGFLDHYCFVLMCCTMVCSG